MLNCQKALSKPQTDEKKNSEAMESDSSEIVKNELISIENLIVILNKAIKGLQNGQKWSKQDKKQ